MTNKHFTFHKLQNVIFIEKQASRMINIVEVNFLLIYVT